MNQKVSPLPLFMLALWAFSTLSWWVLAFPPTFDVPPDWLAQAQSVCFGTQPNGLPAGYGWGLLIIAPLGMLVALIVGWGGEIKEAFGVFSSYFPIMAGVALVFLLLVTQAGWMGWRVAGIYLKSGFTLVDGRLKPFPPEYPRLNRETPSYSLTNQRGEAITGEKFSGRVVYMSFVFGNCAAVCPSMLKKMEAAIQQNKPLNPAFVVISLDGWRDTPSSLAGIIKKWELPPEVQFLTGHPFELNKILDKFNVPRFRDPKTGEIDHPALMYVLDRKGRLAYAMLNPSVLWIVEAGRRAGKPM